MRIARGLPLLALSVLLLGGCADDPAGTESPRPGVTAGSSDGGGASDGGGSDGESDADRAADADGVAGPAAASLTLTTSEGTTTLALTEVRCSGAPGEIRHLIGTSDDQPPLVELTPGEFVMVKLGQERPYRATDPGGVALGQDGVTFAGTTVGGATLDGTVTCTRWND
ncbi:hypothetical protein [Brachybacterium sp. YJGR34]|uniref:hypothetical protein n=1 Tax=Brachybacterium sp. YJGR34 TaxID=2059911 RepID=UPI000E0A569F|nr:hypothetical protein [Brachybacterium sp. YJGR34]